MDSILDTLWNISVYILLPPSVLYLLILYAFEVYAYIKSKRKGPITLTPMIPFPQDNLQLFKGTDQLENLVPDAKIQYDENTETAREPIFHSWKKYYVFETINEFMASTFKLHSRLPDKYKVVKSNRREKRYKILPKISVPNNARIISIKMDGYEHGEKCHDFEPIGGAAPGSHYTYQMYGDNRIQVTRYVVDGRREVAGFCIYIEHPWLSPEEYRWSSLEPMTRHVKITAVSPTTERRKKETKTELVSLEWTIKYCSKRRRKIMSSTDSGEVVLHQEWSDKKTQMIIDKCKKCTKEGLVEDEEQPPAYSSIFIA